jgi:hypothetical protein
MFWCNRCNNLQRKRGLKSVAICHTPYRKRIMYCDPKTNLRNVHLPRKIIMLVIEVTKLCTQKKSPNALTCIIISPFKKIMDGKIRLRHYISYWITEITWEREGQRWWEKEGMKGCGHIVWWRSWNLWGVVEVLGLRV